VYLKKHFGTFLYCWSLRGHIQFFP